MIDEIISADEAAKRLNVSVTYVRNLCLIGKKDKKNGIVAEKVGKEWRIPVSEINRKLGIKTDEGAYKRELYIKQLENEIQRYKLVIASLKNSFELLGVE